MKVAQQRLTRTDEKGQMTEGALSSVVFLSCREILSPRTIHSER